MRNFLIFVLFVSLGVHAQDPKGFFTIPQLKDVLRPLGRAQNPKLNPDHIQVTVWNMFKGKKDSWKRDYADLTQKSDILVLQEMFLDEKMKQVFGDHVGFEYTTATSFLFDKKQIATGVATASHSSSSFQTFLRSQDREPIVNTPKVILVTTYPIDGHDEELLVVNIHAINFVTDAAFARHIFSVIPKIKNHKGPLIFAGDFNTWSQDRLDFINKMAKMLNLNEIRFFPDSRMRTFGNPLDHVFYRGLELKDAKVWGDVEGSDHKAMEASFRIPLYL